MNSDTLSTLKRELRPIVANTRARFNQFKLLEEFKESLNEQVPVIYHREIPQPPVRGGKYTTPGFRTVNPSQAFNQATYA
jgi:hypothetical protein